MSGRRQERAPDPRDESFVDERGVTLTRAGVAEAGRIAESRARHDEDYFAALRDRLGIPPAA
jgi:hypothetical protein